MKAFLRVSISLLLAFGSGPIPAATAAVMQMTVTKVREDTKTLAQTLTPQEHTILEYYLKNAAPDVKNPKFWADKYKKDGAAKATPQLLEEYRTFLKDTVETETGISKAHTLPLNKAPIEQLTEFERFYAESRAKQAGKTSEFKKLLATAKGQKLGRIAPFVTAVRNLIHKDLTAYSANQKKPVEESFVAWLGAGDQTNMAGALASAQQAILGGASGSPGTQEEAPAPATRCTEELAEIFANPIECGFAAALIDTIPEAAKLLKQASPRKLFLEQMGKHILAAHGKGIDGKELSAEGQALLQTRLANLKKYGIPTKELTKHYCTQNKDVIFKNPSATPTLDLAKAIVKNNGANSSNPVTVKKTGSEMDTGQLAPNKFKDICTAALAENTEHKDPDNKLGLGPAANAGNLANTGTKLPGETKPDVPAPTPEEPKKFPTQQVVIGAGVGAIGFGILGLLLGGPVGMLIGAAIGAAFLGGISFLNNGGYDYITGG